MKKSRKIFSILSSFGIIVPVTIAVSCGASFRGDYRRSGGQITLISDSGSVKDKSFNEFIFEGIQNYSVKAKLSDKIPPKTYSYIQPQTIDKGIFQKSYQHAIDDGTETLVLPGFHHSSDGAFDEIAAKNKGTAFIGIDTWGNGPNIQNLVYSTQQSAFLAAIYSGLYMNKVKPNEIVGDKLKVATFGGAVYPSVTAYMDGWLQGVRFFNDEIRNAKKNGELSNFKEMEQVFVTGDQPSINDFSSDFNPGSATDLSKALIRNGAQVVMAVAGPQTADFIGAALGTGRDNIYAIGVDTDQSQAYDATHMIGSALKGIDTSTTLALEDLYNGDGTKDGHGINSGNVEFKINYRLFNYNSVYTKVDGTKEHVVDFLPSKAVSKEDDAKVRGNGSNHSGQDKIYEKALSKLLDDSSILDGINNSSSPGGQDNRLPDDKLPIGVHWGYNEVKDEGRDK
ncbi:MAG: BMP family ABC transporter substrate-binding protein [Mycoplasmatales bacterium]|nr:BMP family ABC transporter substrate-binding protein [Mycoplasmatales bacterium]